MLDRMFRSSALVSRVLLRRLPMHAYKASSTASARPGQDMPVPPISAPVSSSERTTWLSLTAGALTAAASVCLGLLTVNTSQLLSLNQAQFGQMENKMDRMESHLDEMKSSTRVQVDEMKSSTRAQLDMMNMRVRLQDLRARCLSDIVPDDPKSLLFALKATNLNKLKTEEDVLRLELHLRTMQKARGKDFDAVEEVRSWLDHVGS